MKVAASKTECEGARKEETESRRLKVRARKGNNSNETQILRSLEREKDRYNQQSTEGNNGE